MTCIQYVQVKTVKRNGLQQKIIEISNDQKGQFIYVTGIKKQYVETWISDFVKMNKNKNLNEAKTIASNYLQNNNLNRNYLLWREDALEIVKNNCESGATNDELIQNG